MLRTLLPAAISVLSSLAVCQNAGTGMAAGEQHVEYICRMYCTDDVSRTSSFSTCGHGRNTMTSSDILRTPYSSPSTSSRTGLENSRSRSTRPS